MELLIGERAGCNECYRRQAERILEDSGASISVPWYRRAVVWALIGAATGFGAGYLTAR
jgi:hypothetical protein